MSLRYIFFLPGVGVFLVNDSSCSGQILCFKIQTNVSSSHHIQTYFATTGSMLGFWNCLAAHVASKRKSHLYYSNCHHFLLCCDYFNILYQDIFRNLTSSKSTACPAKWRKSVHYWSTQEIDQHHHVYILLSPRLLPPVFHCCWNCYGDSIKFGHDPSF